MDMTRHADLAVFSMGRTCNVKFTGKRKETHTVRLQNAQPTARRTPGAHGPGITTPRIKKARGGTQAEKSRHRKKSRPLKFVRTFMKKLRQPEGLDINRARPPVLKAVSRA